MTDRDKISSGAIDEVIELCVDRSSPHFREFLKISESFASNYKRFIEMGFPPTAIGVAMLGATINIYSLFGIRQDLPALFRQLAEWIETDNQPLN